MIRKAAEAEFTEDNLVTLEAFLKEQFQQTLTTFNTITTPEQQLKKTKEKTETFRTCISRAMKEHEDSWECATDCTLSAAELDSSFDDNVERTGFTVWTRRRVYFPICFNYSYVVESVSRLPDGVATILN